MKVVIVGWYGTETLGDRGILAGIFSLIHKAFPHPEFKLGSLYPYFTDRTLAEDSEFYKVELNLSLKISLFNSKSSKELDAAIRWSDLVIMGGGPLMHIHDLFMVEYAFRKATKLGKKTMIFGCGVGPMFRSMHIKSLLRIIKRTDLIVLRDEHSQKYLSKLSGKNYNAIADRTFIAPDPSIEALLAFNRMYDDEPSIDPYIAINLRAFPKEYLKQGNAAAINEHLGVFLKNLSESVSHKIRMIPMHYFFIGNDDRDFMNELRFKYPSANLEVQNEPLNLRDTMMVFKKADYCFGMRFHSVVFQTILNGKNSVLDYTEPGLGKIGGFLSIISPDHFYQERTINLQTSADKSESLINQLSNKIRFYPDVNLLTEKMNSYITLMHSHL